MLEDAGISTYCPCYPFITIHLFQLLVQLLYELKKPAPETLQSIF